MAAAYAWADVVICRAGALTLAELCAAGVGSLLVPFPQAVDDHQTKNAQYLVDRGAAHLLPQGDGASAERISATLEILGERERPAAHWRRPRARSPNPMRPSASPRSVLESTSMKEPA